MSIIGKTTAMIEAAQAHDSPGGPRIFINPNFGNLILDILQNASGLKCHMVMIVCPTIESGLGQPTFVSSLEPEDMEKLITHIAGGFVMAGKPTVVRN